MAQDRTASIMRQMALAIVVAVLAVFLVRLGRGEVAFCRGVLAHLAQGRQSVQRQIDWDHLQALEVNVGEAYARLPNAREQEQYRRAFVQQFAVAFQRTGAAPKDFTGWRIAERSGPRIVVAADYPSKRRTLLLQVSGGWKKRVVGIQWQ